MKGSLENSVISFENAPPWGPHKGWRPIDIFSIVYRRVGVVRRAFACEPPQTCVNAHEGNAWVTGDAWVGTPLGSAGTKWSQAVR